MKLRRDRKDRKDHLVGAQAKTSDRNAQTGTSQERRETFANGDVMVYKTNGTVVRHETEAHKRDRRHFESAEFDIFKRGHTVPENVCILGPGINAMKTRAYNRITADEIIAINYAVLIKRFLAESPLIEVWPSDKEIDSWCVCEFDIDAVPWFKKMFAILEVRRYFSTNTCVGVVNIPTPWDDDQLYTYQVAKKAMRSREYDPAEGLFHPDTTAIGVACCLAVELGAKRLELCGCDLFGNTYYDGTTRGQPQFNDAPIPNADRLDSCLRYLVDKRGIEIVTLSETALLTPEKLLGIDGNEEIEVVEIGIDPNAEMRDGFNTLQV